ncbi:MAG: HoxN/HupN/NixA family nickel/cobalt transporter [Rhodomicrobium sp.]
MHSKGRRGAFAFRLFSDSPEGAAGRIAVLFAILAAANIAAWAWALIAFRDYPLQLGTAFLAYTFGLRHAVDADHIAAIDNVTRKLMQEGKRPAAAGFFFSLGHSTVVWLGTIAIALATAAFKDKIEAFKAIGGVAGTVVSASFLLAIATMNIFVLAAVYKTFRHVKAGGAYAEEDLDMLLSGGGFIARLFRPLFRAISRSWHMYPLGLLFGLGFDTATEIGLLGLSAAGASQGMSLWSILVFPALFTAGMSLVDTTDSILMLKAYGWGFVKPVRKLYYNMTMTFVSVLVALIVGGLETLNLIGDKLELKGSLWETIGAINDNFGIFGYLIIGVFVATWAISALFYRFMGYDRLEPLPATPEKGFQS